MLNPNNDRIDYGNLLTPPEDYKLDFAVGTTYSLDLDALLGACLSLGLYEETDSELINNPIYMLEALRTTSEKIALFCEGGQIHVPNKPTKLFILLEKIVFSIHTKKKKGTAQYPSFHPKFWLIRYVNDSGEVKYRVIVLSRNLTFDRSWDVVFSMDGLLKNKKRKKNSGLCDFLAYLRNHLPKNENAKAKNFMIRKMISEIPYVDFQMNEKEFDDYDFIPHGISEMDNKNVEWSFDQTQLFTDTYHELLVISPFLSNDVIKELNGRIVSENSVCDYTLVTRAHSLANLKQEDVKNFNFYTLKDLMVDGEELLSQDGDARDFQKHDIHAKLYITKKYSDVNLYLGSLNASHNALYGNVEFMIHLKCKNRYINPQKIKNELFTSDPESSDNPFQLVDLNDFQKDEMLEKENRLDQIIKKIDRMRPNASVVFDGQDFAIRLSFNSDIPAGNITIKPMLSNKTAPLSTKILFEGLQILQLSEFYEISVSDGESTISRIITIQTQGIPERREQEVVNSIVSNRDSFYRYIAFVLGDSALLGSLDVLERDSVENNYKHHNTTIAPAIYEKLLKAVSEDPSKLDGIEYLLKTVTKDNVIPKEFECLYNTIKRVIR